MLSKIPKMVENQLSSKFKVFQTNSGGDFVNFEFTQHLENCGVLHVLFWQSTPEQNDVSEETIGI